jgi:hypothetical protein
LLVTPLNTVPVDIALSFLFQGIPEMSLRLGAAVRKPVLGGEFLVVPPGCPFPCDSQVQQFGHIRSVNPGLFGRKAMGRG